MANIADLIVAPELKSSKLATLPMSSADQPTANKFIRGIVQYCLINQYSGIMPTMNPDVALFFRQSPEDPALGEGFAQSRLGHTFCWIQPSIKVGDQYKHLKPPKLPVIEEKDRADIKLQCSVAIETQEFMENYDKPEVPNKLINFITDHTLSSIHNTINDMFIFFWINLICAGQKKFVFDRGSLFFFQKKVTAATANTQQDLLKKYQEDLEPEFQKFKVRAQKVKNFKWYNPVLRTNWITKKDNSIEIVEAKEPDDLGNDQKSFIKKIYTKGGNTKTTPESTRDMSIFAMLTKIRKTITDMTSIAPKYSNSVGYDTKTAQTANTELEPSRCNRKDLIIVVSEWDYDDLKAGVSLTGASSKSLNLDAVAEGIRVIKIPGIPPGFAYVGETWILQMYIRLNHSGELFHWREEESQFYTNFWFTIATFTNMICGAVVAPCGNFTAPAEFYEEFANKLD